MFKQLAINTASSFGFRLFSLLLGVVSVPILVKAVGADGYGIILLAQSVMGYFSLLDAGVPAGTVKYVAEFDARGDRKMVDRVVATSFTFFVAAGALAMVTVATFAALGGVSLFRIEPEKVESATRLLYIAAGFALINWPLGTFGQVLEGLQRYPENKVAVGVGDLISRAAAIGAALLGAPLEVIFLATNARLLVTVPLQLRSLRKFLPAWSLRATDFRMDTLRMIFGYSTWMLVGRTASLLIYQTDRIILAIFLPVASLTVYQVVTMPFLLIRELSSLYNSAVTPAVSAVEARQGRAGLDTFIYTLSRYSNAFIAPLAVMGALLSASFVVLWMGPEYRPYAWIAQVACLFQMLWQSNSTLNRVFYGSGIIARVTLIGLAMAVLNVPLGIWWVQEFGVAGVVLSTVAVGIGAVPLQYLFAMPELKIDRRRYWMRCVIGSQWTSWLIGLLLIPALPYLGSISSWPVLIVHAAGLAVLLYGANWFATVDVRHRRTAYQTLLRHA